MAGLSPETLKAHTFAILRQLWLKSSQQHPLILAVEDLHWSDPTSEELFTSLVERIPGAAILFLGTYRPGYRPAWLEKSYATQLTVPPLSAPDSVQVLRAVLQRATVPPPLAKALLARAQGNPFFLEELAQTLVEQGVLQGAPTSRPPLPWPALPALQLPPTVQAVLAARIDGLSREDKHLLQCAAVIGTDMPVPLLQAITELPEEALHRGLAHLQAAELLYETRLFPEPEYTFKHALTQEVAYGSLLLERRPVPGLAPVPRSARRAPPSSRPSRPGRTCPRTATPAGWPSRFASLWGTCCPPIWENWGGAWPWWVRPRPWPGRSTIGPGWYRRWPRWARYAG